MSPLNTVKASSIERISRNINREMALSALEVKKNEAPAMAAPYDTRKSCKKEKTNTHYTGCHSEKPQCPNERRSRKGNLISL